MNILFCGDQDAEDGILIATLSLLKNVPAALHLYVLTMNTQHFHPFSKQAADFLRSLLQTQNKDNSLKLIDCTGLFFKDPPTANLKTRFTPYAMLRLYADELPFLPTRLLYLDDDVIVRRNLTAFYQQDLTNIELVGVLDFWGRFFFHNYRQRKLFDYLNSGVLLINLAEIKRTGLFKRVRQLVQTKKMLLPDQAALNKLASEKRIAPRLYNEQYRLHSDTVIQHFTTSFRFWPYFHTLTVKPWEINRVHKILHLHEYDDLLNKYLKLKKYLN